MPSSNPAAREPRSLLASSLDLKHRLTWLTVFRTVSVSLLMVVYALRSLSQPATYFTAADGWVFTIIGLTYALSLASGMALQRGWWSRGIAGFQVAGDIVIATALVFFTGAGESPLTYTLLLAVLGAGLVLGRRGAVVVAAACAAAYVLILFAAQLKWVVPPQDVPVIPPRRLVFLLVSNLLAIGLTALLAGFLGRQLTVATGALSAREEDLRRLTALHEQILTSMGSGLLTCTQEGQVTYLNRAGASILGVSAEEALRMPLEQLLPGLLGLGEHARRRELRLRTQAGTRVVGLTITPLEGAQGQLLVVFQDLTELRRMEEDLHRADRLAALGKMSAQLAHEIRNPLAAMRGSAQLLAQDPDVNPGTAKLSRILVREADRLSRLVENFLRFARPPQPQRREVALGTLVTETVEMLRADPLAEGAELEVAAPDVSVQVDPDQLRQVLLNLLRNALQAVGHAGRVAVRLEETPAAVHLRVWDSAGSIPSEHMPRLFEPFFTTREGGTGLGLATAHSIVAAHGGRLQVQSSDSEGTEFLVVLPRDSMEEDAANARVSGG